MSDTCIGRIIQEFKIQRLAREETRKSFHRRISALQQTTHHYLAQHYQPHHHLPPVSQVQNYHFRHNQQEQPPFLHHANHNANQHSNISNHHFTAPQVPVHRVQLVSHSHTRVLNREEQNQLNRQQQALLEQNKALLQQAVRVQNEERERLINFQGGIKEVKDKYLSQVEKMTRAAAHHSGQLQQKIIKIKDQITVGLGKNQSIQKINAKLKNQVIQGNTLMGKYITQIKQEYGLKLQEVQKIYVSSNQKIQSFEKSFNEDQFVENTIKNEELLKGIEENAKKAQQASQLLNDYKVLLQGKKQILQEIGASNKMKEQQIQKMQAIEVRMKAIMDNMNKNKALIIGENKKMTEQLIGIKKLLLGNQLPA